MNQLEPSKQIYLPVDASSTMPSVSKKAARRKARSTEVPRTPRNRDGAVEAEPRAVAEPPLGTLPAGVDAAGGVEVVGTEAMQAMQREGVQSKSGIKKLPH